MIAGLNLETKKLICSSCGKIIHPPYKRLDDINKIFCDECYSKAQKCEICGEPAVIAYRVNKTNVCYDCYVSSDRCKSCGTSLKYEQRYIIPGLKGFYCEDCNNSTYHCSRCSKPVSDKSNLSHVDENLYLCTDCRKTSVVNQEVAHNILVNVAEILKTMFGFDYPDDVPLYLITRKEMNYLKQDASTNVHAEKVPCGVSIEEGNVHSIYMLTALPLSRFISVLTHEYTHIWAAKNKFCKINTYLSEGFAEWVSSKIHHILGYEDEIRVMETTDTNYISVYTKLCAIEKEFGFKSVLDYVKITKD